MKTLFSNARIIGIDSLIENGWLFVEDTIIRAMGSGESPIIADATHMDAHGLTMLPGFIDVHVHGGMGHEALDCSPDGILEMAKFYAQQGTTSFLATTWTESREKIMQTLEMIAEIQGTQEGGATILGVHLEGPYIDEAKRGAQREEYVRRAEREEALAFLDTHVIRLVSLAPEYQENWWLIDECRQRGITVSAAHSSANYEQMIEGINRGITHSTHTYNAMVGLSHRKPGGLGAVMTRSEVYCELIADNIHVHPAAMQILYAVKGRDKLVLITDAVRVAGLADGEYLGEDGRTVVVKDGAVHLPDGTLAGSTLTMDRGLRNFMKATGEPLKNIWQCSSLNAARSIHIAHRKGSLEIGKDADLLLVDDNIKIHLTMAEGKIVHRAGI